MAVGQAAELLFCEPPFFLRPKFRWIDARTSSKASAIRRPGEDAVVTPLIVVKEYHALPRNTRAAPRHLAESASGVGVFDGPATTVTVASGSSSATLFDASAACCSSTACSIFRKPRTFCHASEPWRGCRPPTRGLATRRGGNGCRSSDAARRETPLLDPRHERVLACPTAHSPTGLPSDSAHSLALAIKR